MNREQMRQAILAGDERIVNSVAWRFMTDQEKRLLRAGQKFWADTTSDVTNAALDALAAIYNALPEGEGS